MYVRETWWLHFYDLSHSHYCIHPNLDTCNNFIDHIQLGVIFLWGIYRRNGTLSGDMQKQIGYGIRFQMSALCWPIFLNEWYKHYVNVLDLLELHFGSMHWSKKDFSKCILINLPTVICNSEMDWSTHLIIWAIFGIGTQQHSHNGYCKSKKKDRKGCWKASKDARHSKGQWNS